MKLNLHNVHDRDAGFSFLPEDYLERKAERRTNIVSVTLFSVVLFAIVAAFFVTNQQWSAVKRQQEAINVRYMQAAKQIESLRALEAQKREMFAKALITTALLEKAPRTVLLADLINRMPERLALLEFNLTSKRIKPAAAAAANAVRNRNAQHRTLASSAASGAAANVQNQQRQPAAPEAPRFETIIDLIGVAPTHNQVAAFVASLQQSPLLRSVELKYSETTFVDDLEMIQFRVEARLRPDADARKIGPVEAPRDGFFPGAKANQQATADEDASSAPPDPLEER